MPGWSDVFDEISIAAQINPHDYVRGKYLKKLHEHTKRNVICYYSAFLTKTGDNLSIRDSDMTGFMNAVKDIDTSLGLDLILHTPGGSPMAAEAIVNYLRSKFGTNIRIIVPQIAMSAGTMIACAGKEIVMGNQSSLGPIDPQVFGKAAFNIKKEYEDAKAELLTNPASAEYWSMLLGKYPPAMIYDCMNAIELSTELATKWLLSGMFKGKSSAEKKAAKVVSWLNQNTESKNHGRHFDKQTCKNNGLKIVDLETNGMDEFQDLILSLHHSYMLLFANVGASKIIENHKRKAFVVN